MACFVYAPPMEDVKFGANHWNQYSDWSSFRGAGIRADRLGYDSIWTWDHLYPIVGSDEGPMFEGWLSLAAWAETTERARIGLMVGANTFRNPAAGFEDGHHAGSHQRRARDPWHRRRLVRDRAPLPSGWSSAASPGERLRWLEEAVGIMRGMLHGEEPSGSRYYAAQDVRNDPPPVQERLPILIGGGGERKTLRIVARYADACNVGGGFENVKRKDEILRRHCEEVGRDESEIERTAGMGTALSATIRPRRSGRPDELFARNGKAEPWKNQLIGTPSRSPRRCAPTWRSASAIHHRLPLAV